MLTVPLLLCCVVSGWAEAGPEGDGRIVVIVKEAPLMKDGRDVVGRAPRGTIFTPLRTEGEWSWVALPTTGPPVMGWVYRKHVATLEEALVAFSDVSGSIPDADVLAARGAVWHAVGDDERAVADFDDAARLAPSNAAIRADLGAARLALGDYGRAVADLDAAIRLDPKSTSAHKARSIAKAATGRYAEAIADLDAALAIDPEDAVGASMRATAREARGDLEGAAGDYARVARLRSGDAAVRRDRARVLEALGRYDEALADLKEAVRLAPSSSAAHDALARLLASCPDDSHRDGAAAVAAATKACDLSAWVDGRRLATLAAAEAEAGDFDRAVKWQERAIAIDGRDEFADSLLDLYKRKRPYRLPPAFRPDSAAAGDAPEPGVSADRDEAEERPSEADARRSELESRERARRNAGILARRARVDGAVGKVRAENEERRIADEKRLAAEEAERERVAAEEERRNRRTATTKQTDTFGAAAVPAQGGGMFIVEVHAGTPAAGIGLEYGDVIHSINGYAVNSEADYFQAVRNSPDRMKLVVRNVRDGSYLESEVQLDR